MEPGGDANSYYKRIQKQRIIIAARFFMDRATEQTGETTVTLLRKKNLRGFVGGSADAKVRDKVILRFSEILFFLGGGF